MLKAGSKKGKRDRMLSFMCVHVHVEVGNSQSGTANVHKGCSLAYQEQRHG
jgi:hypothetical protein